MSEQYDNEGKGVLFKNDQKGNEKAPWYKGKIQIQGRTYELAAWVRESKKDGSKFLSLVAADKTEDPGQNRREEPPMPEEHRAGGYDPDKIPF